MINLIKIFLVKLITAHLVCDFVLQTDAFCEQKNILTAKGVLFQLIHALLHAVVAFVFVAQWSLWWVPLIVFLSHFIIDLIKALLKRPDSIILFVADQFMHVLILLLLGYYIALAAPSVSCDYFSVWVIASGYLTLLKPTSILISHFFNSKKWGLTTDDMSLPMAGRWIGYFERILVMTFILLGSYEAIGFLMAAKSIFRFGELRDKNEIKRTEYVLLGTMMSFTIAVVLALVTRFLISRFH